MREHRRHSAQHLILDRAAVLEQIPAIPHIGPVYRAHR